MNQSPQSQFGQRRLVSLANNPPAKRKTQVLNFSQQLLSLSLNFIDVIHLDFGSSAQDYCTYMHAYTGYNMDYEP